MAALTAHEPARRRRAKAESPAGSRRATRAPLDLTRTTAQALALLPSDEWTVFKDVRLQGVTIEYVVVGPGGVFVVESRSATGIVRARRDALRQKGRRRDKVVSGVVEAANAVGLNVPGLNPERVRPVLCFARDERIMGWGRNVMVCSTSTLVPMLLTHPTVLSAGEQEAVCQDLEGMIRSATVAFAERSIRRAGPRHSAANTPPSRTDRRGARRATKPPAGVLVPFGAVGAVGALVAINPELVSNAGQLLSRVLG